MNTQNQSDAQSLHPYFQLSSLPFESFDFKKLDFKELKKALELALEEGRSQVKKITSNSEAPNFENTLLELERADENLDLVSNVLFNYFYAFTNDEVQGLVEEFSPKFSEYSNEILLNAKLFSRVKELYEKQDGLNAEQKKLLEKSYKSFVKNGALLNDKQKEELVKIDSQLSVLSPTFSKNLLAATNAFEWTTTDKAELDGIPESYLEAALEEGQKKGKPEGTYYFSLQMPSLTPILKYAKNRELRERFYKANATKATTGENSNQETIKKIVKLRDQKAKLLGFENYAAFILQDRMAKTPSTVFSFLEEIRSHSIEAGKKEVQELKDFAEKTEGLKDFQAWDLSYYSQKLKEEKYNFNEEELKPYFALENVLEGAFEHAQKLYGLSFKENKAIPVYQEDARAFEVSNEKGEHIGVFYTDFFPRESKKGGAWCTHFRSQGLLKGELRRPHVSIVCNFSKPTQNKPSLLDFREVETLFHEFGHALHELLSQCTYRSLSGTSVYWDFVELPSQIMENWCLEEDSLNLFAKHYQTGEKLPQEMIEKLKKARSYMSGYNSIRQLNFAFLDMYYHTCKPEEVDDLFAFEKKYTQATQLLDSFDEALPSCAFGHIFGGGYAAGYYSYKWAEVLDADAFEYFKEKGIFNREAADSFRQNILERGGTEDPEQLYINFRGRKADVKALLRRDRLI